MLQSPLFTLVRYLQTKRIPATAGFGTAAGHLSPGPYVKVEGKLPYRQWQQDRRRVQQWLAQFYLTRKPLRGARLILRRIGMYGAFLITNEDADVLELLTKKTVSLRYKRHLREFKSFQRFLSTSR